MKTKELTTRKFYIIDSKNNLTVTKEKEYEQAVKKAEVFAKALKRDFKIIEKEGKKQFSIEVIKFKRS